MTNLNRMKPRVLTQLIPPRIITGTQQDLVDKIKSWNGRSYKEKSFGHFTVSMPSVGSAGPNIGIEVDPYFETLRQVQDFLAKSGIQRAGAHYELNTNNKKVYVQNVNRVSIRFYGKNENPYYVSPT